MFGAKCPWIKRVQSMRLYCVNVACCVWQDSYTETGGTLNHFCAWSCAACYLPCSSGNSPTGSDNLDQSVGSMNPHLPGAQDKISRPSQVVRDWRHEITFSVFDSLLSQQNNAKAGDKEKKKWVSFTRLTLPSHPFTVELRHQLWWCAVLLRAPHQDAKHSLTQNGVQISWIRTCLQNYPVVAEQIQENLQLRSSLIKYLFTAELQPINLQPLFSHCSQDSIQALLWRCIFLHWFQYSWTSLCHATSADNKRERGTEGEGGGEIGGCLGNRSPFCNCALLISWKCSSVHGCAL